MGPRETNAAGLVIHQLGKALHRAAAIDCQGHSRIIAGLKHQAVQQLLHRQNLIGLQVHGRSFNPHCLWHNAHPIQHIALLADHQRRHDFGGAGNETAAVCILLIENPAGVRIH